MNWIQVNDLPIVKAIINKAQASIKKATGAEVSLAVVEYPYVNGDRKEAVKDFVKSMICNYFKVNWDLVTGKCKEQNYVDARWAYSYLMVVVYKQSFKQTGRDLKKDHTTIMHAVNEVNGYLEMKTDYSNKINELIKMLPE